MKSGYDQEIDECSITMSYIPMDLITEHILPRLPVKPLCRFKSVCKNWLFTISSPNFAKSHLKTYSSPCQFIVLTYYGPLDQPRGQKLCLLSFDECNANINNLMNCDSLDFKYSSNFIRVVGSCNGIVCLCMLYQSSRKMEYKFVVWNPVTDERSEIDYPDDSPVTAYGFAYLADEYKIVVHSRGVVHGGMAYKCFHVFSLSDRKWKKIPHRVPFPGQNGKPAVVVNGELYWIGNKDGKIHIFKFNLATQVFEKKQHIKGMDMNSWGDLFQIKGCLGLRCFTRDEGISDIWLMKNADDWNSWHKLFSISFQGLVYFTDIGKCIVQCDEDEYHLVDFTQEALQSTMIGIKFTYFETLQAKELVESLVSPLALLGSPKNQA